MNNQSECMKTSRWIPSVNTLLHLIVFLCRGSEGLAVAAAGSITNVTVGESVLFPVTPEGDHSYIVNLSLWSITLVSWSSRIKVPDVYAQYENRIDIQGNGSVRLNSVQLRDSGHYQMKIEYRSGGKAAMHSSFHLEVFEPVPKPNITVKCLRNNIILSCSNSQGSEATHIWETLLACGKNSCVHLGQTTEIHSLPPSKAMTYMCAVQNPVSAATSDPVDLGACSSQQQVGRWVPVLSAVLLTLFIIGALICLHKRKRRNRAKYETEQAEIELAITEEAPSVVPSIEPVYVTQPCLAYVSSS